MRQKQKISKHMSSTYNHGLWSGRGHWRFTECQDLYGDDLDLKCDANVFSQERGHPDGACTQHTL